MRRGGSRAGGGAAAALLLFVALALFGARWHWVEEAGSAERDGYVAQAEAILAGELPRDPFRPALYPLAIAALAALGVEPFAAARLLSNAAAAALALLAMALARRLAGGGGREAGGVEPAIDGARAAGWWAFALVAVNPNLWILGQHASTDMPFAALAAAALLAGLAYLQAPGWRPALAAGAALGLAAFTRGNALFLAPGLALAWLLAPARRTGGRLPATRADRPPGPPPTGRPAASAASLPPAGPAAGQADGPPGPQPTGRPHALGDDRATDAAAAAASLPPARPAAGPSAPRRRAVHLAGLVAGALLLVAPHFALRAAAFGDPFHDENWKNLAWKLHGHPDWSYLDRVPYAGPGELLREEAGPIATAWLAELARFARSGLSQLLGTPLHALAFLAGAALAVARRPRAAGWLLVAAGGFLAGVALVFFAWGRLVLVLLPVAAALTFAAWGGPHHRRLEARAARRLPRRPGLPRAAAHLAAAALVALLALKTFAFRLPAFVDNHPYAEVAAARELAASTPPGTVLAGTSPFVGRYLPGHPWLALPDAFGPEIADPARYYARLHHLASMEGIDYLVLSQVDLRDRPPALLGPTPPVPWLAPMSGDEEVRVWRVIP